MSNFGSNFTAVTPDSSGIFTGANNGLSRSTIDPAFVVWGNDFGQTTAQLLSDREIPLNGFIPYFTSANNKYIAIGSTNGASIDIQSNNAATEPGAINFYDQLNTSGNTGQILFDDTTLQLIYARSTPTFTGIAIGSSNIRFWSGSLQPSNSAFVQIEDNATIGNVASPIAILTLGAGAALLPPPFAYTAGAFNTVPVNGAKEFDGTNEALTAGGVRYLMAKTLTTTANLNFPNTNAQLSADLTIALVGAADGDVVLLGVPIASQVANTCYTAFVSAPDTITVRFNNYSAGAVNPNAGDFRISIVKY